MSPRFRRLRGCLLAPAAALVLCCVTASGLAAEHAFDYFAPPGPHDPWSPKIAGWQSRERHATPETPTHSPASVSVAGSDARAPDGSVPLRQKFDAFRVEERRSLARRVAAWIQTEARLHYFPDGRADHWATLEETLERGGDDCDGLELLVNQALRDLGFSQDEVFRAIVYRPSDGQHHMVTFWFEERNDPWVIDPTGAMTAGMPRMSDLPEWRPLKVFSEQREFTVRAVRTDLRP
jgi:predicted transglutaminase-like cysteine proteinase